MKKYIITLSLIGNRILLLGFLLITGAGLKSQVFAQKLAVLSRLDDKVVFIDLKSGRMYNSLTTGNFPHEIAIDTDLKFAYISSYGGNTVTKIDLNNETVVANFDLGHHHNLHGIHLSSTGSLLWITSEKKKVLIELDTDAGTIINEWATYQYRSHMVTATSADNKLYVANIDSGSVSIINRSDNTVKILYTGDGAEGIDSAPDGSEVWVSNRADNTLAVIQVATDRLKHVFPSGGVFPVKLKFRPDGREVWVSNNSSGTVTVFDPQTYSLKKIITVGERPLGLAFSSDSRFAYVTRPGSGQVIEIDILNNYRISRTISTLPSPDGIVWYE